MSAGLPSDIGAKLSITATAQASPATAVIIMSSCRRPGRDGIRAGIHAVFLYFPSRRHPPYTSSDISSKLIGIGMPDAFNFSENFGTMPVA